jgi:hypothetical protein
MAEETDNVQNIATESLDTLHKVTNLCYDALKGCLSVNDYENAVRGILNTCNIGLQGVDGLLSLNTPDALDTTDLTQDEQAVEILSPSKNAA